MSRTVAAFAAAAVLWCGGVGRVAAAVGPPHHIVRPPGIGTGRVMVLRPHRVDLFDGGHFDRSVYLDGQHASLGGLADAVADPAFVSRPAPGTLLLTAALVQRPATSLAVGGAGVRTVELRADSASPAFMTGTRAAVTFTGVTVTGIGRAPESGQPYVAYGGFSVVSATSSRFSRLGRSGRHPRAALGVGRGTQLTASNVTFTDDVVGVEAANSARVRLLVVTVSRSSGDGIELRNAGLVTLDDVAVNGNRNGLVLAGPGTHLSVTGGLTALDNRQFGISVSSSVAADIRGARTRGNGVAGINVHDAGTSSVTGMSSSDEPIALRIDSGSRFAADGVTVSSDDTGITATPRCRTVGLHRIVVTGSSVGLRLGADNVVADAVTVTGSGVGLQITSTAHHAHLAGLTVTSPNPTNPDSTGVELFGDGTTLVDSHIDGAHTGLSVGGADTTVTGGTVSALATVIAVRGHADTTIVNAVKVSGGVLGVSVGSSGSVHLISDVITGSSRAALRTERGNTVVTASTLVSTGIGVDAHAPVTVRDSRITAAVGARIASGVTATFDADAVYGSTTGIHVDNGAHVRVISTHVTGHIPIAGEATVLGLSFIGPLPLHWLGAGGLSLIAVALLLAALSRSRERSRVGRVLAPEHVTNP